MRVPVLAILWFWTASFVPTLGRLGLELDLDCDADPGGNGRGLLDQNQVRL